MLSQGTITKESFASQKQILGFVEPKAVLGIKLTSVGAQSFKAGMAVTGDIESRSNAFVLATTTEGVSNAVGVILHDVECGAGATVNSELLLFGFVDTSKLEASALATITAPVKTALKGNVTFFK